MAGNSVDFLVNIQQKLSGNAATELEKLEAEIRSSVQNYKALESALSRAAGKLGTLGAAVEAQQGVLAGLQGGEDAKATEKATAKLARLTTAYQEQQGVLAGAQANIDAQQGALSALASELDMVRDAEAQAAEAAASSARALAEQQAKVLEAAKAAEALAAAEEKQKSATEAAAQKAAKAAEVVAAAEEKQKSATEAAAQKAAKAAEVVAAAEQKKQLAAEEAAQKAAQAAEAGAAQADVAEETGSKMGEAAEALGKLGGPLGAAGNSVLGIGDAFRKLAALGPGAIVVAIAVAFVALGAVIAAAVIAAGRFALAQASARRDSQLVLEAIVGEGAAARALSADMRGIESATGIAAERQTELVRQLREAKVPTDQMARALRALATAEAAGAPEAAQEFFDELKSGQKTVDELAQAIDGRFGAIAAKRMQGLDQQAAKFDRDISALFGGLDAGPALAALQKLASLFDDNTATGQTLKFLMTALFQPLLDSAEVVFPIVEAFVKGMVIAALKLYIAVKPAINAIGDFFDVEPGAGVETALYVGAFAFGLIAAAATLAGIAMVLALLPVVVIVAALVLGVALMAIPFLLVAAAVYGLYLAFEAAFDYIAGLDFGQVATDLIMGLGAGIAGGASFVLDAVTNLANSMMGTIKGVLGIHSPSTVFASFGRFTSEGMAIGIDDGAGEAQSAVSRLIGVPSEAAAGGRGAGRAIHIENLHVHGANAQEQADDFLAQLARALEGRALAAGAELDPEPA